MLNTLLILANVNVFLFSNCVIAVNLKAYFGAKIHSKQSNDYFV